MYKTYAVSDLHGFLDLWHQIDAFTDETDTIYVLGDCGDRGPQSWQTIKEVYESPKTIYLKGNHEDMTIKALEIWLDEHIKDYDYHLSICNGGYKTFRDALKDFPTREWLAKLKVLPETAYYINKQGECILMSHAGYTPGSQFFDFLWDRGHFWDEYPKEAGNSIIVHGHTPITYLMKEMGIDADEEFFEPKAFWYCDGHKVDIDCGTYSSYATILLDLDTFEEHIFETEVM